MFCTAIITRCGQRSLLTHFMAFLSGIIVGIYAMRWIGSFFGLGSSVSSLPQIADTQVPFKLSAVAGGVPGGSIQQQAGNVTGGVAVEEVILPGAIAHGGGEVKADIIAAEPEDDDGDEEGEDIVAP
jgi:hypothetical protein